MAEFGFWTLPVEIQFWTKVSDIWPIWISDTGGRFSILGLYSGRFSILKISEQIQILVSRG